MTNEQQRSYKTLCKIAEDELDLLKSDILDQLVKYNNLLDARDQLDRAVSGKGGNYDAYSSLLESHVSLLRHFFYEVSKHSS